MKKFAWFLTGLLPLLGMLVIQVAVGFVVEVVLLVKFMLFAGSMSEAEYASHVLSFATDKSTILTVVIASQVVTLLIAAIIYYFAFKKKKIADAVKAPMGIDICYIVFAFVGAELVFGVLLSCVDIINPDLMSAYRNTIESSGLADMTWLSAIATLILAPISEEIIFRGMTMNIARKFTKNFWIANVFQAFVFGIAHMNIVQSTYAFVLGLLLGYVYRKYNSLFASMIGHLAFNFTGTFVAALLAALEGDNAWVSLVLEAIVGGSLFAVMVIMINRSEKAAVREPMFWGKTTEAVEASDGFYMADKTDIQ